MARARNLKPGFFDNETLAECEPLARLLFAGLWLHADREGRLEDRPKRLKAQILPHDNCDASALLDQLERHGFLVRYQAGEGRFLQVVNFAKHQNPHPREPASSIPDATSREKTRKEIARQEQAVEKPEPARPLPSSPIPHPESSEAIASAAVAAVAEPIAFDTKAAIFGEQLAWLRENTGKTEGSLRSWLGKCCGEYGEVETLAAILNIRSNPTPVDPISRMRSIMERQGKRNGTGQAKLSAVEGIYAGFAIELGERERQADRRADSDPPQPLLDSRDVTGAADAAKPRLAG